MKLVVNGREHRLEPSSGASLLDLLRTELGLTGAKPGCGTGACGACTVLLDGRPVRACGIMAVDCDGCTVETVEGLEAEGGLHPLQEEFLRAGAVGCGYCTPGMLMGALGFLRREPSPPEDRIRQALAPHLCRCTGYEPVVAAVKAAAARMRGEPAPPSSDGAVGSSPPRLDGVAKVTGRLRFTADAPVPAGCLHGVVVRSPVAHGELVAVDHAAAREVPGVVRILTAQDLPELRRYGKAVDDQEALVTGRLLHRGDPVALVLGETEAAARAGAESVRISTRPLAPLLDPAEALSQEAPRLHPDGNEAARFRIRRGDPTAAFRQAHRVVSSRLQTPFIEHALLECEAALAVPEEDGSITVHAPSQNVFFDQALLARILGISSRERSRIRVIQAPTGAAFGKREDLSAQIPAVLGARATGRPVRVIYSRRESHGATTKRHPMRITTRTAWSREGALLALDCDILAETGPYASWAANVLRKAAVHSGGPYRIPAARVEARGAYTNRGVAGAMRGYGATQALLAVELHLSRAAQALGIDPLELRLRHALEPGEPLLTGQALPPCSGLARLLEAGARDFRWKGLMGGRRLPDGSLLGHGVAGAHYGIGYGAGLPDRSQAELELTLDGRILLRSGAVDYGQGAATVLAQMAAQELGAPLDALEVAIPDTARTPDSGSTVASRQTRVTGAAVQAAAGSLREALERAGVCSLGTIEERRAAAAALEAGGQRRLHRGRGRLRSQQPDPETGLGDHYASYALAACFAEVRLEPATGRVRVTRLVSVHDSGRIINPALARAQVSGGVAMGLGMALTEEYRFEAGNPLDLDFDTYRIPRAPDMPELEIRFLEDRPDPEGPFGARGLGEPAMLAVAPAVLGALADAAGAWPEVVPATPERVLRLLSRRTARP